MAIRVVQWTTGNVGKESVKAIMQQPDLELVGCYAWSDDKVGRDVGELSGIGPVGVEATNDIHTLLSLKPDCVAYNPMWRDVDEMIRILEAGANIVTTAAFITGHSLGADRDKLTAACERGDSTLFGTGISPGFVELLAMTAAGACSRIDKVTVVEEADTTEYDSPDTEIAAGFGRPITDPDLPAMTAQGTAVFGESVRMIGDALGVEFDEIRCEAEYAQTTTDLVMQSWTIPAGCVAGIYASWQGRMGDRTVVELSVRWRKGQTLDPDWQVGLGHTITIDGLPTIQTSIAFLPPLDFQATTMEEFMVLGHIMTAVPAIDAIPAVVAAPAGIVTYADFGFPMPRGMGAIYPGSMTDAESPASDEEFGRLLVWSYRGELQGEAMFGALAGAWANEGREEVLLVLADLERRMGLALAPLLRRHSLDGGDDERSRRTGREIAAMLAGQDWDGLLSQFAPATGAALQRDHRLRDLASDRDPTIDELIAHEEALSSYAAAELRGEAGRSLDQVYAVIEPLSISN